MGGISNGVKHRFRHEIVILLVRILRVFVFFMPMRFALYLGALLGGLAYSALAKHRNKTIANLRFAFKKDKSDYQIRAIAKSVFKNLGKNMVEVLSFSKIKTSNIDRLVSASGVDKIDALLKEGRGVLIVAAHLGNWELLAAYFALKGYSVCVVARHLRFDKYERMILNIRESKNIRVIDRTESPREVLEALKKNSLIGILPDQNVDSVKGIFIEFFGSLAYTPIGPASLARAAKIPIVPCFIVREGRKHRIFVDDPIRVSDTGDREQDLRLTTKRWSGVVESYIRKYPSQWVWMHPRWKIKS